MSLCQPTSFKNGPAFPDKDCAKCPRLQEFRNQNRQLYPDKFNAPVPSFGGLDAQLLIAGLAPGLKGANFSGRPFTGDYAGVLLYDSLITFGFANGVYRADPQDGLELANCRISNVVKCLPPENKPTTSEIKTCQDFFHDEIAHMPHLKIILALGKIAHDSILRGFQIPLSRAKFAHGAMHDVVSPDGRHLLLVDSYHCSRYNTQTGRLTTQMFEDIIAQIKAHL